MFNLWIAGIPNPDPAPYASRAECNEVAKKIAGENKWLHYFEVNGNQFDKSLNRPRVYCEPAEWSKRPRKPK